MKQSEPKFALGYYWNDHLEPVVIYAREWIIPEGFSIGARWDEPGYWVYRGFNLRDGDIINKSESMMAGNGGGSMMQQIVHQGVVTLCKHRAKALIRKVEEETKKFQGLKEYLEQNG